MKCWKFLGQSMKKALLNMWLKIDLSNKLRIEMGTLVFFDEFVIYNNRREKLFFQKYERKVDMFSDYIYSDFIFSFISCIVLITFYF